MNGQQQASNPTPSSSVPVGMIVLLSVACFFYIGMMANLGDVSGSDAAGRGLAQAFGALAGLVLWILLAVALVVGGVKGRMPVWAAIAAVVLLPLSAYGAVAAMGLAEWQNDWALLVPGLLPPLFALYALWARLPALHKWLPPVATSAVVGAAILLISVAPIAASYRAALPNPEREAKLAEQEKARQEKERRDEQEWRAREDAKFAALGPDSSLKDYLDYMKGSTAHQREAFAAMKLVKSRQADAVALLLAGWILALPDLKGIDIAPTPELCQAYGAALSGAAGQINKTTRSDYINAAIDLEWQLPNMRWLVGAHCDLAEPLGLLETNVRAVADSSRMTKFADTLAGLRNAK
jgi:hypothetical protein